MPYGTEVSAKYRGAFCEAKIKKIIKCVKCRVSFIVFFLNGRARENVENILPCLRLCSSQVTVKDTNQHLNVLDDDIKGVLKVKSVLDSQMQRTKCLWGVEDQEAVVQHDFLPSDWVHG